jgi:hypothetical protein
MPLRIAMLPRDHRGYPVPHFVQWIDGKPEFPLFDPLKWKRCVGRHECWVCGQPLGRWFAFTVGPMCIINRISSEPPSHRECVEYAAQVCPFIINPAMRRVPTDRFGEVKPAGGKMDEGNPGTMALWITRKYEVFGTKTGPLIKMGDANELHWFRRGRRATPQEAADAFEVGAAKLIKVADTEAGEPAVIECVRLVIAARKLLPDPSLVREIAA